MLTQNSIYISTFHNKNKYNHVYLRSELNNNRKNNTIIMYRETGSRRQTIPPLSGPRITASRDRCGVALSQYGNARPPAEKES